MNASMVPLEKTCSQKCSDKNMEKRFHEITQANKCILLFCKIVRNYIPATCCARSTKNVLIQRPSRVRQNRCLLHRLSKLVGFTEQASGARVRDKRERDDGNTPLSLIIR